MKPLPDDRFVKATIPLYYQGHAYREGSRIRVSISAVGGDQPIWAFATARPKGTPQVDVALGKSKRSKLTLPVRPWRDITTELPPVPRPPRRALPGLRPVRKRRALAPSRRH